ncbi:MAG: helix-turn-helix domain-containing protein [Pirellulales bacterium]
MRLLTAEEFGDRIGLSAQSVRQMGKDGRLPAPVRIGSCVRWRESDVNRFISGEQADAVERRPAPGHETRVV